jgi:hypothetical protein
MSEITLAIMIGEVQRELEMRRSVYPRRVSKNMMSVSSAKHQLEIMEAVYNFLVEARDKEKREKAREALSQSVE